MPVHPSSPMTNITFQMLGSKTETTVMIRIRPGNTIITSVKRMMIMSTEPPK